MSGKKLNITSEEINDEENAFQNELKTPTGQSSGQYITPTSNMSMVQAKKMGQNAPSQVHHTSRIMISNTSGGANSQPIIAGTIGSFGLPSGVGSLQYN